MIFETRNTLIIVTVRNEMIFKIFNRSTYLHQLKYKLRKAKNEEGDFCCLLSFSALTWSVCSLYPMVKKRVGSGRVDLKTGPSLGSS
jgi:hypothetical protein